MIEEINKKIVSLIKQKLEEHFSHDDFLGITAMWLGRPDPYYLNFFDIVQIVKRYTTNKDIISNIPNEIEIVAKSLIDGMVKSSIYKKLSKKDIIDFMFETIKNFIENSELLFNEFQKDKSFFDLNEESE